MEQKSCFSSRPDVFSRDSLELTFQLLRQQSSGLALDIQNQLQGTKLPYVVFQESEQQINSDHFRITLNAQKIGRIVDALTQLGQQSLEKPSQNKGHLAILRALIEDWMALAEWLISHAEPPSTTVH